MPETTHLPVDQLRSLIDLDGDYEVQVSNQHIVWTRPTEDQYHRLVGLEVWRTLRRAQQTLPVVVTIDQAGEILVTGDRQAMRFIPADLYIDNYCRSQGCEDTTTDGEGWMGLCGNCADRAYAAEFGDSHPDEHEDPAAQLPTATADAITTTPRAEL